MAGLCRFHAAHLRPVAFRPETIRSSPLLTPSLTALVAHEPEAFGQRYKFFVWLLAHRSRSGVSSLRSLRGEFLQTLGSFRVFFSLEKRREDVFLFHRRSTTDGLPACLMEPQRPVCLRCFELSARYEVCEGFASIALQRPRRHPAVCTGKPVCEIFTSPVPGR